MIPLLLLGRGTRGCRRRPPWGKLLGILWGRLLIVNLLRLPLIKLLWGRLTIGKVWMSYAIFTRIRVDARGVDHTPGVWWVGCITPLHIPHGRRRGLLLVACIPYATVAW